MNRFAFAARPLRRPAWLGRQFTTPDSVLLTFDDGPHPEFTAGVLDRLREYETSAVFFAVGNRVQAAPHLLRRAVAEGHRVGNHTFTHRRHPFTAVRTAWRDVADCQQAVTDAAGDCPTWFRPPFGRLTPGLLATTFGQGMRLMTWSLDSNDWRCRSIADAERCAAELAEAARPGDVILFHDNHPYIGPILDVVLPALADRGLIHARFSYSAR